MTHELWLVLGTVLTVAGLYAGWYATRQVERAVAHHKRHKRFNRCPKRQCRGWTDHKITRHLFGWVRR